MVANYTVNLPGPYHIKKNIPCQDAYCIKENSDGIVFAAVADGLGSEEFSDIGAKVASSMAVGFCRENYKKGMTDKGILNMMCRAFIRAYLRVKEKAEEDGNDVNEYDSTLCMAIYDSKTKTVYYGQSGDSGMIVGNDRGEYCGITTQQRNEFGEVFPLCFGPSYWQFGKTEGDICSVMLMTDGVLDQVYPRELREEEQKMNVAFVDMFMNRYGLGKHEIKMLQKNAGKFMRDFSESLINDDKTIVVILDSEAKPKRREDSYYAVPDWEAIAKKNMAKDSD